MAVEPVKVQLSQDAQSSTQLQTQEAQRLKLSNVSCSQRASFRSLWTTQARVDK
jgi:hypothetical protein